MCRVSANKNVLSSRLKSVRQMSCCRSSAVRLFHSRGPTTPKLLSPSLDCVRGTVHVWTSADRRCRRPTSLICRLISVFNASTCVLCVWFLNFFLCYITAGGPSVVLSLISDCCPAWRIKFASLFAAVAVFSGEMGVIVSQNIWDFIP